MKDTAAQAVGIALFAILSLLMATAPDQAAWLFFTLLGIAVPVVVIVESAQLIAQQRRGGRSATK